LSLLFLSLLSFNLNGFFLLHIHLNGFVFKLLLKISLGFESLDFLLDSLSYLFRSGWDKSMLLFKRITNLDALLTGLNLFMIWIGSIGNVISLLLDSFAELFFSSIKSGLLSLEIRHVFKLKLLKLILIQSFEMLFSLLILLFVKGTQFLIRIVDDFVENISRVDGRLIFVSSIF